MSYLSGKCDLADHISFEVQRHKDGTLYKHGDEYRGALYSDLYECYKKFEKKTNGTLYQHKNIKVTENNAEFIAKKCDDFKIIEHKENKIDNRTKSGTKEVTTYTYQYYGKEYTLKELNKKGGVYITVKIKFNNLIELIPYLPRIISASFCDGEKEIIYISDESFAEDEYNSALKHGYETSMIHHYRSKLAELYQDVVLNYYNPIGHQIVEELTFEKEGNDYIAYTSTDIDDDFPIRWHWVDGKAKSHWTSPEKVAPNAIKMSNQDFEVYLGNKMSVEFVEKFERPIILS